MANPAKGRSRCIGEQIIGSLTDFRPALNPPARSYSTWERETRFVASSDFFIMGLQLKAPQR